MITEQGREMLRFQAELAETYHYKPIGYNMFLGDVRQKYIDALPEWCRLDGDPEQPLLTHEGMPIATGYRRIVVGDYGAFVEMAPHQMILSNIMTAPGQEFRVNDESYRNRVKYFWFTSLDSSKIKLYFQRRTVKYADYLPDYWYVSVYEVMPGDRMQQPG